jgi:hypothetical protein
MATTFNPAAYRTGLQTLLDRQGVAVTVKAFEPERSWEKLAGGPVAELVIEQCLMSQTGALRELDVVMSAGLLVILKLNDDQAEENAFALALDVATGLVDEVDADDPEAVPVFAGAPIDVTNVEPEALEGALQNRCAAFLVSFEHAFRVRRTNEIAEPAQPTGLLVGRAPNIGEGHEGDYRQIVPVEE